MCTDKDATSPTEADQLYQELNERMMDVPDIDPG